MSSAGRSERRQRDRETRGDGKTKAVVRTAGSRTLEIERMHKREILRGDACLRGKGVAPLAPPPAL
jgi:hypothetical protein